MAPEPVGSNQPAVPRQSTSVAGDQLEGCQDEVDALARSRAYSWFDPFIVAKQSRALTGLEYAEGVCAGTVQGSPAAMTTGYVVESVDVGQVVARLTDAHQYLLNFNQTVQGGVIASILDGLMTLAIRTKLPAGYSAVAVNITCRYIRAIRPHFDGTPAPTRIKAVVEHAGRSTATAYGTAHDSQGRLCASASLTALVMPLPEPAPTGWSGPRERTYTWSDLFDIPSDVVTKTGLEIYQDTARGDLPSAPSQATFDYRITRAEKGLIDIILNEPGEFLLGSEKTVQGGIVGAAIDSAVGCAVHTALPAGRFITTLDLNCRYLRFIGVGDGPVLVRGIAEHIGDTTSTARGEVFDRAGHLCATATTTLLVLNAGRH